MLRSTLSATLVLLPSILLAGDLEVFEIPDADPPNGLYRPDIQDSYPQVNWQTLDVLCLPAGQFKFIRIGNLPDRTAKAPLTITNCAGQTRVGGLGHYYLFVLGGGSHWRLTGEYSEQSGTGHPDLRGHADGRYANSQGSYGILVDDETIDALDTHVQELGEELFSLVEDEGRKQLLLNFSNVEFLSSAALNKLIILDKKVKSHGGKLKLSNLKPEIYEVFVITRLNQLFDIKDDEAEAVKAFG